MRTDAQQLITLQFQNLLQLHFQAFKQIFYVMAEPQAVQLQTLPEEPPDIIIHGIQFLFRTRRRQIIFLPELISALLLTRTDAQL